MIKRTLSKLYIHIKPFVWKNNFQMVLSIVIDWMSRLLKYADEDGIFYYYYLFQLKKEKENEVSFLYVQY
jgi:hypothetical protein